jgi:predicted  nucleic acid-binding Zn-ribbon protein
MSCPKCGHKLENYVMLEEDEEEEEAKKGIMDRPTIIEALKVWENQIRELRQSLEAEERREVQGGKLREGDVKRWLEG